MSGKTGKKFMSVILSLALVLSLMPAMTLTASAADSATFNFESDTSPVANGSTASATVTQEVDGKSINIVSTGGQFVVGAASALLGDYPTTLFVGNVVAFDGYSYSTRITVSLPGYIFDLNSIAVFDNYKYDHSGNSINMISSNGTYDVEEQVDYHETDHGGTAINVSGNSDFQNITSFDFYANGDNMQLALDNISLTNIRPIGSPTVVTSNVSTYAATTATMGGIVTDSGSVEVTDRGIVYSTADSTPTIDEGATKVSIGTGVGGFSQSVTGLSPNTTYYVNAYATNSIWTSYGTVVTFKTAEITASISATPALTEENLNSNSLSVTLIGTTFADSDLDKANFTLNNAPSGVSITDVTYNNTTGCTITLAYSGTDFDSNVTNFSLTIAGAELDSGIALTSGTLTITATSEAAPTATTGSASSITSISATLWGTVNPNSSSTTVTFEYGTPDSYGTSVEASQSPVSGAGNTTVSCSISGLTANTTYHYRVKAVSKGGTAYGLDQTFSTDITAPTISGAVRDNDMQITVTLSEACQNLGKNNSGGFTVKKTGTETAYEVSKTTAGADNTVVLTVADLGTAGAAGVTVTYETGADGTIADLAGNALATDATGQTIAAWKTTAPTITSGTLSADNAYIDVEFSEGVYGAPDGTTVLAVNQLALTFTQNGGTATNVVIAAVKTNTGAALAGGETTVRVFITITGTPNGLEKIEVIPADGASIFDKAGNAVPATQTTNAKTLHDQFPPKLVSAERTDNTHIMVTLSKSCTNIAKASNGGFTVAETGVPETQYTVSAIAQGANASHVILTVANLGVSAKEGVTVTYTAGGNGTVQDTLGNVMATDSSGVLIAAWDTDAPVVSSIRRSNPSSELTNSASVIFRVTFSEAVTEVDVNDFVLATTGHVSGEILDVSSLDHTSFDVTVDSMSGTGLLGLNLKSSGTEIADIGGNAIAAGYSSGETYSVDRSAPTVTAISPNSGPTAGGTTVVITGTNLTDASAVRFGGADAENYTVNSATQITATAPARAAGEVNITVTTACGTSTTGSANLYSYVSAPTITSISPDFGPLAGGTSITITGTNFTGATSVKIGGTAATGVSVVNETTITAVTPAGTNGAADVEVTTPGGTGSGTGLFTYAAQPTVTSISPDRGPLVGGTTVTITGTNFTGATSVTVGGAAATNVSVVNATTITAVTPARTAGTADIEVATPGGTGTGTGLFTYVAPPTVTGVSSSTADGSYKAGDVIMITVTFSKEVTVTGTPQLTLETGTARQAVYTGGSDSNTLTFTYTVQSGDNSQDLNYRSAGALTGTIKDTVGNDVVKTLAAPSSVGSLGASKAIVIDTTAPVVSSVTVPNNGTYKAGDSLRFTVNFSEAVTVTGTPQLVLDIGGVAVNAAYSNGNNTTALVFTYTIVGGNTDTDGILIGTALSGTVKDAAGNDASFTLNGVGSTSGVLVDTTAPEAGNSGTINVSDLTNQSAKLTWTKGTDDRTLGAALQYKVVYSTSNITTVVAADALAGTWTTDIVTATVTGLTESTDYYFNVLVKDQAGNMALYSSATGKTPAASVSDDNSSAPSTPSSNAAVEVNGEKQNAGQTSTKTTGGQTVTTITVDDAKLDKILEQKGSHATVTLPASGNPDAVVGQLTGQTVKSMEQKEAVLEIKTETATYTLPASQINIDTVSAQLGARIELKDIKVNVKISEPPADTVKTVEDTANRGNYQLVVKPIEFEISCTSGSGTVEVSRFNGYVERTVALPTGVDPSKITTGIVLNADGTFSHVPTRVIVSNGKYYAKINSLTNSTYSVIYNPVTFPDVASHWAKDAVNDMGSRLVVSGVGGGMYEPERSITRAEFATIVVRAMGLKTGIAESAFVDVSLTDWFNGYVDTATSYGLINGYDSMSYGPNDTITREQAMTILTRAMKLTGLSVALTDSEASAILANYTDADLVSDYAKSSVAACIKTGIVSGTTSSTLSPKDSVTRAEVAVMVQRLLQKSELI